MQDSRSKSYLLNIIDTPGIFIIFYFLFQSPILVDRYVYHANLTPNPNQIINV